MRNCRGSDENCWFEPRRLGDACTADVGAAIASYTAVIARLVRNCALGRVIQYSEAVAIGPMGRGVLDAPPSRGMTPSSGRAYRFLFTNACISRVGSSVRNDSPNTFTLRFTDSVSGSS